MSRNDVEGDERPSEAPPTVESERRLSLEERILQLESENERLRAQYTASRQSQHQKTALGLGTVGLFAAGFSTVAPGVREPLLGIAAIGLFSAVITWYLTPGQFVPADVGESVFEPLSRNEAALVDQLGLSEERIYLETEDGFRLYVPQRAVERSPPASGLDYPLVVTDEAEESGLSLEPSGAVLYREHDATRSNVSNGLADAVTQLGESLRENFELVRSVESTVDTGDSRVTVEVVDPAYDDPSAFDHPVVSFLGVGLAAHLDRPVSAEVSRLESGAWALTYRW